MRAFEYKRLEVQYYCLESSVYVRNSNASVRHDGCARVDAEKKMQQST